MRTIHVLGIMGLAGLATLFRRRRVNRETAADRQLYEVDAIGI